MDPQTGIHRGGDCRRPSAGNGPCASNTSSESNGTHRGCDTSSRTFGASPRDSPARGRTPWACPRRHSRRPRRRRPRRRRGHRRGKRAGAKTGTRSRRREPDPARPEAPAKMLPGYVRASVKRLEQTPSVDGEEEFVRRPRKTSGDAPGDDAEAAGAAVDAGGPSPRAPAGRVRTMHRPTAEAFRAGPAATREPCVLTGLDVGPAPWTWSPSHLAAKPGGGGDGGERARLGEPAPRLRAQKLHV